MTTAKTLFFLLISLLVQGCAVDYLPIRIEEIPFYHKVQNSCISYSIQYNTLLIRGNTRYAQKESKHHIKVMAIEFTNLTKKTIHFKKDVIVKIGGIPVSPIPPEVVKAKIHQSVPAYLLHTLLFLRLPRCQGVDCGTTNYPIGVPIALGNMAIASNANAEFLSELKNYDVAHSTIKPGETIRGILSAEIFGNQSISFVLKNSNCTENKDLSSSDSLLDYSSLLYFSDTDSNYQDYIDRLQSLLMNDIGIIDFKFYEKKSIKKLHKCRGFKARHIYANSQKRFYKIGTWEYYNKEGLLEKTVDYNLKGKEERVNEEDQQQNY